MTDDERDARIETLTDAIAETNRAVNVLTTNVTSLTADVASLTSDVTSLTAGVTSLTGDVASLSRLMRTHLVEDHDYPDIDDDE